ncbi:MAG: alkaline phosphatase [Bacteroidales bacterium]|jgi:alkaline phosphatase|nr:alkaline phosphatase [Bacteroidales bacterium]
MKKVSYLILSISILFVSCDFIVKDKNQAKNVILLIGDGMGVTQIYAAISISENTLNIEKFKHVGFHKTYSSNNYITDSGASGTALATGVKTNNKSIGIDSVGNSLNSILLYAEENQLATGLISTSAVTHATPASFIAHESSRYDYENIAKDFLDVDIDIFIGGGKKHFANREDHLNLVDSLKKNDYHVIDGINNLDEKMKGKFAVFTAEEHNPKVSEGRGDMLAISTEKAINILDKKDKGFFLMIEGSQIDWGGHDLDIDYVVSETLDFDKAVGKAHEFAIEDGETLVIVTADHETGGLTLLDGNLLKNEITANFSTDNHTAVMVPVFAFGPGAENFGGIYENTDVFEKMMKAFGF